MKDESHIGAAWKRVNGRRQNSHSNKARLEPLSSPLALTTVDVIAVTRALNDYTASRVTLNITDSQLVDFINNRDLVEALQSIPKNVKDKKSGKLLDESYVELYRAIAKHHSVKANLISDKDSAYLDQKEQAKLASQNRLNSARPSRKRPRPKHNGGLRGVGYASYG